MIVFRQPDELIEWRVVFFERAAYRWARFVPGRFKHVAAYAYSAACRTWAIYDVTLTGTRVFVLPDGPAGDDVLIPWLAEATVLSPSRDNVTALQRHTPTRPLLGFYCVPAVRHLIRARCGAVTPTGLYRALVKQGAEIIKDGVGDSARSKCTVASPRAKCGAG